MYEEPHPFDEAALNEASSLASDVMKSLWLDGSVTKLYNQWKKLKKTNHDARDKAIQDFTSVVKNKMSSKFHVLARANVEAANDQREDLDALFNHHKEGVHKSITDYLDSAVEEEKSESSHSFANCIGFIIAALSSVGALFCSMNILESDPALNYYHSHANDYIAEPRWRPPYPTEHAFSILIPTIATAVSVALAGLGLPFLLHKLAPKKEKKSDKLKDSIQNSMRAIASQFDVPNVQNDDRDQLAVLGRQEFFEAISNFVPEQNHSSDQDLSLYARKCLDVFNIIGEKTQYKDDPQFANEVALELLDKFSHVEGGVEILISNLDNVAPQHRVLAAQAFAQDIVSEPLPEKIKPIFIFPNPENPIIANCLEIFARDKSREKVQSNMTSRLKLLETSAIRGLNHTQKLSVTDSIQEFKGQISLGR